MSKSCAQFQPKDWFRQERKPHTHTSLDSKRPRSYEASASKQASSYHSRSTANRIRQLPAFLYACYELQWFISSRTTLSQALDAAVKQIYSLSALLLFYFTLLLLSAQVAGLAILLSCAVSLPLGFQFMLGSVLLISATAFKIMY